MNVIEVKNLTKKFKENIAVDSLTFHVAEGEVFGLLGPNGAGKTTTIRMLCCLISKTSGEAQIAGYHIGNGAESLAIRKLIGLVPDNIGLYEELSAYENLDYYGKLYECTEEERKEKIEYFLTMLDLWEKRDQPISDYSKGMKQKVAIARALIHDPKLLFLMSRLRTWTRNLPGWSEILSLSSKRKAKRFSSIHITWMRRNGFAIVLAS